MPERTIKIPGPDHPITVAPNRARVVIRVGDRVISDMREALILREADYPAVRYVPRKDVDMAELIRSETEAHGP